ncbi:MAG: SH3 domain-containing protein [Ignavibacteria bacterium]|jgi:hypothetical protein
MAPTRCEVIEDYHSANEEPIYIKKGETVKVGEEYSGNPNWKNWRWCENNFGKKGWVPEQILAINGSSGKALSDYSAKELSVLVGDELLVYNKLNGWAWCEKMFGEFGWVPLRNIRY